MCNNSVYVEWIIYKCINLFLFYLSEVDLNTWFIPSHLAHLNDDFGQIYVPFENNGYRSMHISLLVYISHLTGK